MCLESPAKRCAHFTLPEKIRTRSKRLEEARYRKYYQPQEYAVIDGELGESDPALAPSIYCRQLQTGILTVTNDTGETFVTAGIMANLHTPNPALQMGV